jgi:hypothetical protein
VQTGPKGPVIIPNRLNGMGEIVGGKGLPAALGLPHRLDDPLCHVEFRRGLQALIACLTPINRPRPVVIVELCAQRTAEVC